MKPKSFLYTKKEEDRLLKTFKDKKLKCKGCHQPPSRIKEYIQEYKLNGYTSPEEFVKAEEGTYNPATHTFLCTKCYIREGMPLYKDI